MHPEFDPQFEFWPDARANEIAGRPTESAYWRGSLAARSRSRTEQRLLGQFMTPAPIARFMAETMMGHRRWAGCTVRLLDPAAGSGVLAAALVEAVLSMPERPSQIELLMCELDPLMLPLLERCGQELRALCKLRGVLLEVVTRGGDFLSSDLAQSRRPVVDAVIANPPYFKISGNDVRAKAFSHAVHGQPNIYSLFMAACADLVKPGGAYCFITPRSWTNGAYFRALRACLFERLSVDALHLFESREAHFQEDAVLQEAMITWASATLPQGQVNVSSSAGIADIGQAKVLQWPAGKIVGTLPERVLSIPTDDASDDLQVLPGRLVDLGLKVSTGPVVGFRAMAHLRAAKGSATVPMLWMPHIRPMSIEWPRNHRAEHIEANADSAWMLLPNQPMVLLRRFSPKEELRRITAAPYLGQLPGRWIGLENHLNVIYSTRAGMSAELVRGLAAYLSSRRVDTYLRQVLGSTQVNAVELRNLPVPDLSMLEAIGAKPRSELRTDGLVDNICAWARSATSAIHA